jgi:hypothetical protein
MVPGNIFTALFCRERLYVRRKAGKGVFCKVWQQ